MVVAKLNSKHNKHTNNQQNKHNIKHGKQTIKHKKYNNTWFSTPKKTRNPGHANHVFKKNTVIREGSPLPKGSPLY